MEPIEAYYKIRDACLRRPELKFKDHSVYEPTFESWWNKNPFLGFCYVASHTFSHLIPEAKIYRDETGSHYWNQIEDKVWDLTAEQFKFIFPYNKGVRVRRKRPSGRIKSLLEEVML